MAKRGGAQVLLGRRQECATLDRLLADVRAGHSRALVIRGDAGVGKSVLLEHVAAQATGCRVVRASGVESEMELAFAGLHQFCAPLLELRERLPAPQRDALATAFGLSAGELARPLLRRPRRARAALRGGRGAPGRLPGRRRAVAGPRVGADAGVRRPPAGGRVGRDGLRGPRRERARRAGRAARRSSSAACPSPTRARCWTRSCTGRSTTACATASSPRRAATRSRCWSCRAG